MNLDESLVEQAAEENDVDPDVVRALMALEERFPDMAVWGSKAGLQRAIAKIIETHVSKEA
tara:strand:- start:242 stop:424 length:183 start_codon:yes stop_codon:yes gene_type:complete